MKSFLNKISKSLKKPLNKSSHAIVASDHPALHDTEKDTVDKDLGWQIQRISLHGAPKEALCFDFDPVQRIAAVGTANGLIHIFGQNGVDYVLYINDHSNEYDDRDTAVTGQRRLLVRHVAFAVATGRLIAVVEKASDGEEESAMQNAVFMLLVYDLKTKKLVIRVTMEKSISISCILAPVGSSSVLIGTNLGVGSFNFIRGHIGDLQLTAQQGRIKGEENESEQSDDRAMVTCMDIHPIQDQLLLIGMPNGEILLHDLLQPMNVPTVFQLGNAVDSHSSITSISWHPNKDIFAAGYASGAIAMFKLPKKLVGTHKPFQVISYFRELATIRDLYWDLQEIFVGVQKSPDPKSSPSTDGGGVCGIYALQLNKDHCTKNAIRVFPHDLDQVFFLSTHAHRIMEKRIFFVAASTLDGRIQLVDLSNSNRSGIALGNFNFPTNCHIKDLIVFEGMNRVRRNPNKLANSSDTWPLTGGAFGSQNGQKSDMLVAITDGTTAATVWDIAMGSLLHVGSINLSNRITHVEQWSREAFLVAYQDNTLAVVYTKSLRALPLRRVDMKIETSQPEVRSSTKEESQVSPSESPSSSSSSSSLSSAEKTSSPEADSPAPVSTTTEDETTQVPAPPTTAGAISGNRSPSSEPLPAAQSRPISPPQPDATDEKTRRLTALCALQILNKVAFGYSDGLMEIADISEGVQRMTASFHLDSFVGSTDEQLEDRVLCISSLAHGMIPKHKSNQVRHALFIGTDEGHMYVVNPESGELISNRAPKNHMHPVQSLMCVTEIGDQTVTNDPTTAPQSLDDYFGQESNMTTVVLRPNGEQYASAGNGTINDVKLFAKSETTGDYLCSVVVVEINLEPEELKITDPTLEISLIDSNGNSLLMIEIHPMKVKVGLSVMSADEEGESTEDRSQKVLVEFDEPSISDTSKIAIMLDAKHKSVKLFNGTKVVGIQHYGEQCQPNHVDMLHNVSVRAFNDSNSDDDKQGYELARTLVHDIKISHKHLVTYDDIRSGLMNPDIQCIWTNEVMRAGKYLLVVQDHLIRTYKVPSLQKYKTRRFKTCKIIQAHTAQLFGYNVLIALDNAGILRIFSIPQLQLLMKQCLLQADLMRDDQPAVFRLLSDGRLVVVGRRHALLQSVLLDSDGEFQLSEPILVNTELTVPVKQKAGLLNRLMSAAAPANGPYLPKTEQVLSRPATSGDAVLPCTVQYIRKETEEDFMYGKSVADMLGHVGDDWREKAKPKMESDLVRIRSTSAVQKNRTLKTQLGEYSKREVLFGDMSEEGGGSTSSMMEGIGETKSQMSENKRKINENLDKLEQISEKTGKMESMAQQFYENSLKLSKKKI